MAPKTINRRVNCALHLVDYFLLRADHFGLSLHGFKMVTANDIAALMTVMAGGQFVKANLYAAYEEAKFFLKHKARLLTDAEVGYVVAQVPGIGDVDTLGDRKLALSDAELVRARVYLWLNGYFNPKTCISGSDGHSFYRHQLSPQRLFAAVYQGRILSSCRFQGIAVEELHFNPIERRLREYPMVPTQMGSDDAATNERIFNEYYLALKKMELLSLSGLEYIRPYALSALDNRAFLGQLNMKEAGRYRSLPPEMAFAAFRQAAEFYFEYGECLIGAYLDLVREASLQQVGISSLSQADLLRLLPAKLKGAGIRLWDLSAQYRGHVDEGSGRFFQRFRANEGLLQLIDVLYGSIWVRLYMGFRVFLTKTASNEDNRFFPRFLTLCTNSKKLRYMGSFA